MMTRILLSGCSGKMGRVITDCVNNRNDCTIAAGIDLKENPYADYPIYTNPFDCKDNADVLIDFSHPSALGNILGYTAGRHIPVVVATTGFSDKQINEMQIASRKTAVFFSFNMSLGINLLVELSKKAVQVLGGQFDIELVEKHHNQKVDAPSGTAIMLANAINGAMNNECQYVYDRHASRNKRGKKELGIHSIRGGTIVGEHEIIFAGRDEVITLGHQAMSKEIFAVGALNAALFLVGKEPGLYNMGDLI